MAEATITPRPLALTDVFVGKAQLSGGAIAVAFKPLADGSMIFVSPDNTGVTGFLTITARTNGTGFTITSSAGGDTGFVTYMIVQATQAG